MFVYSKQKSQRDKELKSRICNTETSRNKYEGNITSKNWSKYRIENTESQIIIRVENRKRDEVNSKSKSDKYKTRIKSTIKTSTITKSEK